MTGAPTTTKVDVVKDAIAKSVDTGAAKETKVVGNVRQAVGAKLHQP